MDAFVEVHPGQVDFTWIRIGRRKSRLDRLYVPRERVGIIRGLEHVMHLGDHKALLVTLCSLFLGFQIFLFLNKLPH